MIVGPYFSDENVKDIVRAIRKARPARGVRIGVVGHVSNVPVLWSNNASHMSVT